MATQFADKVDRVVAVQHLRVTRNQYPHIVQMTHGPGQRRRDIAQATGFDQIGEFRGDKQDFLLVGVDGYWR